MPKPTLPLSRLRLLNNGDLKRKSSLLHALVQQTQADYFQVEWLRIARYLQSPGRWPAARYLKVNTIDGLGFTPTLTVLDAHGRDLIPNEYEDLDEFNDRFAIVLLDFQKTILSSFRDTDGYTFPYLDLASAQPITLQTYQHQLNAAPAPVL